MNSFYGYTRVSTAKQGEGVSLAQQKEAIIDYAQTHNLDIVKWFEERETAASVGRPIFMRMTTLLANGRAQGVIIHKIDRSARNFRDWARIGELADQGVEVRFVSESLDFQSRGGRLAADIQAVIAADYIRNLREETIKGLTGRLKQGLYPFKAPLGYIDNGGGKIKTPDPVRASLVKEAFILYGTGQYSLYSLRSALFSLGLCADGGTAISKNTLSRILKNPFYYGVIHIIATGKEYQGIHPPLISKNQFDRVQVVLASKARKKRTRHNHDYRGLFTCRLCNRSMVPEKQKQFVYYRCHTKGCSSGSIQEHQLTESILSAFAQVNLTDTEYKGLVTSLCDWFRTRPKQPNPVRSMKLQIQNIEQRKNMTLDALIEGLLTRAEFDQRNNMLSEQKQTLQRSIQELQCVPAPQVVFDQYCKDIRHFDQIFLQLHKEEKRELLEICTEKRSVMDSMVTIEGMSFIATKERLGFFLKRVFVRIEQGRSSH